MSTAGFTRMPNAFIEALLDPVNEFTGADIKTALLVARDTIGWRKPSARISVATFQKRLGTSRRTQQEALRGLRAKGVVGAEGKEGTVQSYWITSAKNCAGSEESTGAESSTDQREELRPPAQKIAPAYKEERNSSERKLSKKTSSSKEHPEVPVQALVPEAAPANDDETILVTPSATEAEAERGWTPEVFAGVCRMMSEHRGEVLEPDDWARSWLCQGTLDMYLAWWIAVGRKLKPKKPRFGLYEKEFKAAVAGRRFKLTWEEEHVYHAYRRECGLLSPAEVEAERVAAEAAAAEAQRVAEIERQARVRREAEAEESKRRHLAELEAAHAARQAKQSEAAVTITQAPPKPTPAAPPTPDRRALLQRRLSEYRIGLTTWEAYPDEVRRIQQQITDLERDLAALDGDPDRTEADRPAAATPTKQQPTIEQPQATHHTGVPTTTTPTRPVRDGEHFRQNHRKQQASDRGLASSYRTGLRLATLMGGYGA